jgi:hypothetical protein
VVAPSSDAAWRWFVALDGGDLDGLIGDAGVLRFEWPSRRLDYRYFDGVSAGHNVSIAPGGRILLLGNFSQQIVVVDTASLDVLERVTTMSVEQSDYRLRANTHHVWLDDRRFLCAIGDHLYEFDLRDLRKPTRLGAHRLWTAHELRSGEHNKRYVLMGDLGPERSGARQVGVFDRDNPGKTRIIKLPGTVWHTCVHPDGNVGYAATYSITAENEDYVDFAPAYTREYIFEIDLPNATILRVWSSGAGFPIHLNSDLELHGGKLYVASAGGHSVVELDIADFTTTRVVPVTPSRWRRWFQVRQAIRNLLGAFLRKPAMNTHMLLQALVVSSGRLFDGVYAARVSPDGRYLVAGNRGYNYLRVMDRRTLARVYDRQLPTLPGGLHLGMHHSEVVAGATPGAQD